MSNYSIALKPQQFYVLCANKNVDKVFELLYQHKQEILKVIGQRKQICRGMVILASIMTLEGNIGSVFFKK